jgi:hypothetical protein
VVAPDRECAWESPPKAFLVQKSRTKDELEETRPQAKHHDDHSVLSSGRGTPVRRESKNRPQVQSRGTTGCRFQNRPQNSTPRNGEQVSLAVCTLLCFVSKANQDCGNYPKH